MLPCAQTRTALVTHFLNAAAVVLLAALALFPATGFTTSAYDTSVSTNVLSSSSISGTGCVTGTENVTNFGQFLPGDSGVTTTNCAIVFGSTNHSAMLKVAQEDKEGDALFRYANGTMDTGFGGGDGLLQLAPGSGNDSPTDVMVQADGQILVAGSTVGPSNTDMMILRLNPDGTYDTAFDGDSGTANGIVTVDFGNGSDSSNEMAIQSDGKVVIVGASNNGVDSDAAIIRLNTNGTLDTTFSTDGKVRFPIGADTDTGFDVAMDPRGRIVIVGYYNHGGHNDALVARLMPDGSMDTSFSGDGIWSGELGDAGQESYIRGVSVQTDKKVVGYGHRIVGGTHYCSVVRFTNRGALDTTFGGGDGIWDGLIKASGYCQDGVILPDGQIVVGGYGQGSSNYGFGFRRLSTAGAQNAAVNFDVDQVDAFDQDTIHDMVLMPDGSIIAAGTAQAGGPFDMFAFRLTSAFAGDTTFDNDGIKIIPNQLASETVLAITPQTDGEYLVSGYGSNGANTDILLASLGSEKIPDFSSGAADWNDGTEMFGVCLYSLVGANATNDWPTATACPNSDAAEWRGVPDETSLVAAKAAHTTVDTTTGITANFRFGLRTANDTPSGVYSAPIVFEVVSPNS